MATESNIRPVFREVLGRRFFEAFEEMVERAELAAKVKRRELCGWCKTDFTGTPAITFCQDCSCLLCGDCGEVFAMSTFCPNCLTEAKRTAAY
jgi:hypothetical protein